MRGDRFIVVHMKVLYSNGSVHFHGISRLCRLHLNVSLTIFVEKFKVEFVHCLSHRLVESNAPACGDKRNGWNLLIYFLCVDTQTRILVYIFSHQSPLTDNKRRRLRKQQNILCDFQFSVYPKKAIKIYFIRHFFFSCTFSFGLNFSKSTEKMLCSWK